MQRRAKMGEGTVVAKLMRLLWSSALMLMFWAGPAEASHYRLQALDWFSESELSVLSSLDITSTESLLMALRTPSQRQNMAKRLNADKVRLDTLVWQLDLIRFDGIGPTMVKLMQESGIRHSKDLANMTAERLYADMEQAMKTRQTVGVLPPKSLLEEWIRAARRSPQVLEGL